MTPKQLLRVTLALLVVLFLWGGLVILRREGQDTQPRLVLPTLHVPEVDTIVIARPGDTVVLGRRNGQWTVNGYPALGSGVEDLFSALADTSAASELVAQNPGTHARLGVDTANGARVRIRSGAKTLVDLVAGTHGPEFEGIYLRHASEPAVYLVHGRLPGLLDRRADDWRDRHIGGVVPDSVSAIEIRRGARTYALRLVNGKWQFASGGVPDSAAVVRFLGEYRDVSATGFPSRAQADSVDFTRTERQVRLLTGQGRPALTLLFDSTSGGFWARQDTGSTVFRLERWKADQLAPADTAFRKKPK